MNRNRSTSTGKEDSGGSRDGVEKKRPKFDISIYPSWCKDCGICAEFCRKKVFERDVMGAPVISRPDDCNGCQECVLHCPDFAVQVTRRSGGRGE